MEQGVTLYDVRPTAHYREHFIPGAKSLPYVMNTPMEPAVDGRVDGFGLGQLAQDQSTPMILQCHDPECGSSYQASRGYGKAYWYRAVLPDWPASGYPIERGG